MPAIPLSSKLRTSLPFLYPIARQVTHCLRRVSRMSNQALLKHPPIVICGPSGTGKSTIIHRLRDQYPGQFGFSVSHTTRQPRGKEQDGVEYHFVTGENFIDLVDKGHFLEHAMFNNNRYGTTFGAIAAVAEQGQTCILDIEMEGVKQLRQHPELGPKARIMFLKPPSMQELERRLRARGTDNEKDVITRLEQARREIEFAQQDADSNGRVFDLVVVNQDLDKCYESVRKWIVDGPNEINGDTHSNDA